MYVLFHCIQTKQPLLELLECDISRTGVPLTFVIVRSCPSPSPLFPWVVGDSASGRFVCPPPPRQFPVHYRFRILQSDAVAASLFCHADIKSAVPRRNLAFKVWLIASEKHLLSRPRISRKPVFQPRAAIALCSGANSVQTQFCMIIVLQFLFCLISMKAGDYIVYHSSRGDCECTGNTQSA